MLKFPKSLLFATASWFLFAIVAAIGVLSPFDLTALYQHLILFAASLVPLALAVISLVIAIRELVSKRHHWPTVIGVMMSLPLIVLYSVALWERL